jgi:hypothetical protein
MEDLPPPLGVAVRRANKPQGETCPGLDRLAKSEFYKFLGADRELDRGSLRTV